MKKTLFGGCVILLCIGMTACSNSQNDIKINGEIKKFNIGEKFNEQSSFEFLNINSKIGKNNELPNVHFYCGEEKKIEIITNSEINNYININITSDKIQFTANKYKNYIMNQFDINIYGFKFKNIDVANANIENEKDTFDNNIIINLSDKANGKFNLIDVNNLDLNVSGNSRVKNIESINTTSMLLNLSGDSDVNFTNLKSNALQVGLSGNSELLLNSISIFNTTEINCSGSSVCELIGTSTIMKAEISGASNLKSKNYVNEAIILNISGGSIANINATKSYELVASGASIIKLFGQGNIEKEELSGGSKISN